MGLRLAFVKKRYVPFGGGESYLDLLMRRCAEAGHAVHVLTSAWPGGGSGPWTVEPVPARGITAASRLRAFSRAAAARIDRGGFDVVFSLERTERQDVWRAGEGVHRVWLERRRAFESPLACRLARRTARQRTLLRMESLAVAAARRLVANSQMVREDIARVYPDAAPRTVVVRNGVDDARFGLEGREADRARLRAGAGLAGRDTLLLFVGSGFRRKGLPETFAALARLPRARLWVLGRDAPDPWRREAGRRGVADRVVFAGARADLAACYHAADAVVLPSWFDSFANVGLESMRCGTPLVASRYAGVHELVQPGRNGETVASPADAGKLAAAVEAAVARGREASAPAEVSASVAAWTMERNARETLAVIEDAARRSAPAARRMAP